LRFLGALPPGEIPALLASSDAVLVPFPPGLTSDAASPLKLFEAWAAGRPTLASDVAGVREVARDGQDTVLLSPGDIKGWADAVESLAADGPRGRRLGEGAREAAARSSWENRAAAFAKLLREVRRS
jgi:glycosyltransferase involved in cell wall biosynthesis